MASFRSPKAKASHALRPIVAHGTARHASKNDGLIHSIGTEHAYTAALAVVQAWLNSNRAGELKTITPSLACEYLRERAGLVRQKTLDLDRQALQALIGAKLERVQSTLPASSLATKTRSYTPAQIRVIASAQAARHALATEIAAAAGLRAHELLTIRPASERPASAHRDWSHNRFEGREGQRYTVTGKGGLITEKMLPDHLAARLEARRLPAPEMVRDRGINYLRCYDIAGGKAWSQNFTKAAREVLGYSTGAHGLRHAYAQQREVELQSRGYTLDEARGITAQEMGHFSPNTTRRYER